MSSPIPEPANGDPLWTTEVVNATPCEGTDGPIPLRTGAPTPPFDQVYEEHFDFAWGQTVRRCKLLAEERQ